MSRVALRASIVLLAASALTLGVAAPAAAAGNALPVTDAMYAFSCHAEGVPSVLVVDAETGESTGISPDAGDCKYNAAYDEATDTVYVNTWFEPTLSTLDIATGVLTSGVEVTLGGEAFLVDSIAIGQGREAYALEDSVLYSLNLDSGVLTEVVDFGGGFYFWSFAYDEVTGEFYALADQGDLYLVNRGSLTLDSVGSLPLLDNDLYGLQFDSSGLLWYVDSDGSSRSVLYSATLSDLANPVESGALTWNEEDYYSFSLAISREPVLEPVPALAATGTTASPILAGGIAGLTALLLGVGALALVRRRTA